MSYRGVSYRIYPRAEADLEDIWIYTVQKWSTEQADSFIGGIVTAFEGLASGMKTGRRTEIRDGYYKYAVGSHFVYYRNDENGLVVVRVLHQRMDVERHL